MVIQKIISQTGLGFTAIMECEHCGYTQRNRKGHDTDDYHQRVIPNMRCLKCHLKRDGT